MDVFLQTLVLSVSNVTIYILLGTSVSLLYGVLGVLNFAQGDLMTISTYFAYFGLATLGVGWWISGALLVPAMAVVALLFYLLVLRPVRHHEPALVLVATFGAGVLIQGLIQLAFGGSPLGIKHSSAAWH